MEPKPDVTLTGRHYTLKVGDVVRIKEYGYTSQVLSIEPMGYYPYAVSTVRGIQYFAEDELEKIESKPEGFGLT